ncbi:alkylhydroperoxidase AhpD family core domain-containing protein [Chitinophaga rupis]|uniref:Alkylhydroperoxidase AhpD family core domain-containing protein n=1 Tax=Chitinophaga rupis TaxID=573321 RepID=A0A1H8IYZ4_9BACT|nr:carboxymuconolactone decarboxylase family protein [Chitinophaga rupis]SEN73385.1 alkylhydroperoxidase AhpD family core domain-containing protein [Chitinophaga rupis]
MKTFKVPAKENVSPANQQLFDKLAKGLGKVPNLYATMAYSENGLGTYLALSSAKSSLKAKEKEAVNLVVSEVNSCDYCLSAHTMIGKLNGFTDEQILEIRSGEAPFDSKLDALVKLAKNLTEKRGKADAEVVDNFFAAGYTEENLVDTILVVGDKTITNLLYGVTQIPIDFPAAPALHAEKA